MGREGIDMNESHCIAGIRITGVTHCNVDNQSKQYLSSWAREKRCIHSEKVGGQDGGGGGGCVGV